MENTDLVWQERLWKQRAVCKCLAVLVNMTGASNLLWPHHRVIREVDNMASAQFLFESSCDCWGGSVVQADVNVCCVWSSLTVCPQRFHRDIWQDGYPRIPRWQQRLYTGEVGWQKRHRTAGPTPKQDGGAKMACAPGTRFTAGWRGKRWGVCLVGATSTPR